MLGYFDDQNNEYVITDMFPRRELINYLWNENTVLQCNQFGGGFAWSLAGAYRRQMDKGVRNVYLKDLKSGEFYSANRNYTHLPFDDFRAHVGLGYHKVVGLYKGLKTQFTMLVPAEGRVELLQIKIKNTSNELKVFDVYFCNQPQPDISGHESYGLADYQPEINGIDFSHEGFALPSEYTHLYLASDREAYGYETSESGFCGTYQSFENPKSLQADKLACKGTTFENKHVGALQYRLCLQAGEEWTAHLAFGTARSKAETIEQGKAFATADYFSEKWKEQKEQNGSCLNTFQVTTPDARMNSQVNIWLKRQLSLGKTWGRVYSKGYRDVMQDITAFVSFDTALAKKRLKDMLKWQMQDGNTVRSVDPVSYAPNNDGAAWIPSAVLSYVNESGDKAFLDEQISYLAERSDPERNFNRRPEYREYAGTEYTESVFEHLKKGLDYLYGSRGKRGLVLFVGGDWNDSMNNVGRLGKGESVWLTIATVKAYNDFLQLAQIHGRTDLLAEYTARKEELRQNVLRFGVDGDHLLYGYNDYDEKIGSDESEQAKMFLNPQSWAVIAGITDQATLEKYMDEVEKRLRCDYGYVQCAPSYSKGTDKIGRISYFQPGLVENGAVYNHGVAFKIVADCMLGRGDLAYQSLKAISFDNPKNPDNGMEPYAVSNMYIGPENPYIAGQAPMSWITGTAGWLYRCISEYICGIKATFDGLKIEPCFPTGWTDVSLSRKFRGATYRIKLVKGEKPEVYVDGKRIDGNVLPILAADTSCEVVAYYQ